VNVFSEIWQFFAELSFEHDLRLLFWLFIPALIVAYVVLLRMRNRRGMRFTNTSMLDVVVPKQSQWRRHLAVGLSILSLACLTAAFATPHTLALSPRERATVVVVIDNSLSMQAKDVTPNRLDAAKTAAKKFITELPDKYNVSLVAMAGNVNIMSPPTLDHQAVLNSIDVIDYADSTAIGEGINQAMRAISQAPKDPKDPKRTAPGAIVLLSDGESTTGRSPRQEAARAGRQKIPIYTIAYGTENGFVDLEGERFTVPPNKAQMAEIAKLSKGKSFEASSADDLSEVYENIGSEVGYVRGTREVTSIFAGFGVAFALLALLGAVTLAARWP
jgi:Ca-activated chloride channel family protein